MSASTEHQTELYVTWCRQVLYLDGNGRCLRHSTNWQDGEALERQVLEAFAAGEEAVWSGDSDEWAQSKPGAPDGEPHWCAEPHGWGTGWTFTVGRRAIRWTWRRQPGFPVVEGRTIANWAVSREAAQLELLRRRAVEALATGGVTKLCGCTFWTEADTDAGQVWFRESGWRLFGLRPGCAEIDVWNREWTRTWPKEWARVQAALAPLLFAELAKSQPEAPTSPSA